jgi:hypothetical protein
MQNLEAVAQSLNDLLSRKQPRIFNSSWIVKNAPRCHRFIRKHVRSEVGAIDWDRVTNALEPKYQRLWTPRFKRFPPIRRSQREISPILNKYRSKLYVFVAPADATDIEVRERIAIALVRIAQSGNASAKDQLMELTQYTVESWLDTYRVMSRWRGREDQIRDQIAGCIRRYRYSGSFFRYVFCTLQYAGRGLAPTLPLILK